MGKRIVDLEVYANLDIATPASDVLGYKGKKVRDSYKVMSTILKKVAEEYSSQVTDLLLGNARYVHDLIEDNTELVSLLAEEYPGIFRALNKREDNERELLRTYCPKLREEVVNKAITGTELDVYGDKIKGIKAKVTFLEDSDIENQKEKISGYLKKMKELLYKRGFTLDEELLNKQGYSTLEKNISEGVSEK